MVGGAINPDYSLAWASKLRRLISLGHCSKCVVSTVHPRNELVNLQKLAPLQKNRLKHQTRRLLS
jgi:hypothetical protein